AHPGHRVQRARAVQGFGRHQGRPSRDDQPGLRADLPGGVGLGRCNSGPVAGRATRPVRLNHSWPEPAATCGPMSSYAGLTMTGAPPLIPTWPRNLTRDPHIRPAIRDRPENSAVRSPVESQISQASTEFRSTERISTTRTRPSTVALPGWWIEPIGVTPGGGTGRS